ncbi:hypothetical protein NZK27_01770 [Synechococcus sp. FGCU-3]|nr:hypothetical protein [Synechococcus sp. FGCU3]
MVTVVMPTTGLWRTPKWSCQFGAFVLLFGTETQLAPAKAMPSFGDCGKQTERRGDLIDDMDQRGPGYEAVAVIDARRWNLRLDKNCNVLDECLDQSFAL